MPSRNPVNPQPDISRVVRDIDAELPRLARSVIENHLDMTDPDNVDFLRDPDGRAQHQTQWHQWGIISHTRKFLEHLDRDIPGYLRAWDLWDGVDAVLRATIDGASRWDLLHVSILLHDIGKFAARTRGKQRFHFARHESMSGNIIRSELKLEKYGLTPAQAAYVAQTAEDHFVLGLIRKRLREQREYDERFISGIAFRDIALSIKADHPTDHIEIGVLFLGDSLAKADPLGGPERAASQYEINIAVAREYLRIVI